MLEMVGGGEGATRAISRAPWEIFKPMLESAREKTSPRRVDLYEVSCAVLYLLRSGCPTAFRSGELCIRTGIF